jgi:hypothetical protein
MAKLVQRGCFGATTPSASLSCTNRATQSAAPTYIHLGPKPPAAGQLGATVLCTRSEVSPDRDSDFEEQKEFLDRVMVALSRCARLQMEGCNALIATHGLFSSRD